MGQRNDHIQSQDHARRAWTHEKNFHAKGMRTVRGQLPR